MVKYKALVSFSGAISMAMGEIREISDKSIVTDLLNNNYIIELKEIKPTNKHPIKTSSSSKAKKGGKNK